MPTGINHLSDETRDNLALLTERLANDPKTRKSFLGLVKQAAPETPIPEIDTESAIDARLKAEREERVKFENEQRTRWAQEDLNKTRREQQSRFQLSDEDMKKMEEMMTKGELPADYRFAPQLFRAQLDSATPTNYGANGGYEGPFDIETNAKGLEGLMEDEGNWATRTAHQLIDDMKRKGGAKPW